MYAVLLNLVLVYTPVPVNTKTGVIYFILVTPKFENLGHHHPHPHEIIVGEGCVIIFVCDRSTGR